MEARELIADLMARDWTQVQIAERTGITQPTVSKVARGEVRDVMSRSYRRLAALHAEVMGKAGEGPGTTQPAEARDAA